MATNETEVEMNDAGGGRSKEDTFEDEEELGCVVNVIGCVDL